MNPQQRGGGTRGAWLGSANTFHQRCAAIPVLADGARIAWVIGCLPVPIGVHR
jgi:hypothetical protein